MIELRPGAGQDSLLAYTLVVHYLSGLGAGSAAALHQLAGARGRLGGLTAACFLLYRPRARNSVSVNSFVFETAPVLIQQLSRRTRSERVSLEGRVGGKIDWSATFKVRNTMDGNSSVFVCLRNSRLFERPENQLFKFMLVRVRDCLSRVPPWLREWQHWRRAGSAGRPSGLGDYFELLEHRLRVLGGHISLREVTVPSAVKAEHLAAARNSKNKLYSVVADLYELYRGAVESPIPERWAHVVAQTLPLPPGADEFGHVIAAP